MSATNGTISSFRTAVHIVAVSGSLRKVSTNTGLIRAALKVIPQDVTMEVVEIGDLPLFNEDLEKLPLPESVERVRAAFDRADAFLFATPENNYNIAAALKNAFDWASRSGTIYKHTHPLADKPFHVMGSGGGMGGMRGGFALKQMAIPVNMWPLNNPQVWIRRYEGKYFDENGDLIDDKWKQSIATLVQALVDYTRRLRYGAIILKQQKEEATKATNS